MADYCTVQEVKAQIDKQGNDDDAVIAAIITAASRQIDDFCRRPDGFVAESTASARLYTGSGEAVQWIDECVEVASVAIKVSPTDSEYVTLEASDWIAARGDPRYPNFNRKPYQFLMLSPTASFGVFTSGRILGLRGFRPDSDLHRALPTVKVTARWGYAETVPPEIKQACITQTTIWYKRGEGNWSDVIATEGTGMLMFKRPLDPAIQLILVKGGFRKAKVA